MKYSWDVIAWWEVRRIPYNLSILVAGIVTITVIELVGSHFALPGEDVEEPLGIVFGIAAYAVAANVCYSLGWITELLWSRGDTTRTVITRPKLFRLGLIFSILLTLAPAVLVPLLWTIFGFQHGP